MWQALIVPVVKCYKKNSDTYRVSSRWRPNGCRAQGVSVSGSALGFSSSLVAAEARAHTYTHINTGWESGEYAINFLNFLKFLTFATSLRPTASAAAAFFWHVSWMLFTFRLTEQSDISDHHLTDPEKTMCIHRFQALTCSSRPEPCGPAAGRRSPGWWLSRPAWWAGCRSRCPPSWPWTDGISDRGTTKSRRRRGSRKRKRRRETAGQRGQRTTGLKVAVVEKASHWGGERGWWHEHVSNPKSFADAVTLATGTFWPL